MAKNQATTTTERIYFLGKKSKSLQFLRSQKATFLINNVPIKQTKTL